MIDKLENLLIFPFAHLCYTLSTIQKNKLIFVKKKYIISKNGFTNYVIEDHNNNKYFLVNSIWFLQFKKINNYYRINEKSKIYINYYGYENKNLNCYKNIISFTNDKIFTNNNNLLV